MNKKKLIQYIKDNKEQLKSEGIILHDDHGIPKTRREMLASGVMASSMTLVAPTVASMLLQSKRALANDEVCPVKEAPSGVAFLQIHTRGGQTHDELHVNSRLHEDGSTAKLGGGGTSEDRTAYGIAPENFGQSVLKRLGGHYVNEYGAHYMAWQDFKQERDPTWDGTIASGVIRQGDDTSAGLQGFLQTIAMARGASADFNLLTGGGDTNQYGTAALPAFAVQDMLAEQISSANVSDLVRSGNLPADARLSFIEKVADRVKNQLPADGVARKIAGCSAKEAVEKIRTYMNATDPSLEFPQLAGITDERFRTMLAMLANGSGLCAGFNMGGYDYHNQDQQTNQDKNFNVHRNFIVPALAAFRDMNIPLIILKTSDGAAGCSSTPVPVTRDITVDGGNTTLTRNWNSMQAVRDAGRFCTYQIYSSHPLPAEALKGYQQAGYGMPGGVGIEGSPIALSQPAQAQVIQTTIMRAMDWLNPSNRLKVTYQNATGGGREDQALEPFKVFKKMPS